MATWTKIPDLHIASSLGGAVGGIAGTIVPSAGKTLDKIEAEIYALQVEGSKTEKEIQAIQSSGVTEESNALAQQKANAFNRKATTKLAGYTATLNRIKASLNTILGFAVTLKTVARTLKIPLPPLEILIKIIKMLPIPQIYLVVSFTVLESDLLEMMEQLIAQAKEEITALEGMASSLESTVKPVKDRIERIRAQVSLLQVTSTLAGASPTDKNILDRAGIIDKNSGDSIFDKIQSGLTEGNGIAGYGLGDEDIDLKSAEVANQIQLAKEGDTISVKKNPSGSYIETWFCISDEQPSLPAGFPQITGSWTKNTKEVETQGKVGDDNGNEGNLWKVDLKVTGNGNIFGGLNDVPVHASEEDLKYVTPDFGKDEYLILGYNNYAERPGILKIDDWMKLLEDVLIKVRDLPLSQDLKDVLTNAWNKEVVEAKEGDESVETKITKFQWMSKLGEIYNIEILEDEHSPEVAIRRFARVTDQGGTVIMDGIKTFSTNLESLVQEIKLQLDQLTQ